MRVQLHHLPAPAAPLAHASPQYDRSAPASWAARALLATTLVGCSPEVEALAPGIAPGAATGKSLLLVTLDTTRADHLACFGAKGAETPNLDALAARGVRFEQALACVPLTTPSHASLLTGLYPPDHGVRNNGEAPLAPEQATLAELLAARGYDTAAFVSAFVLDTRYGLDQGFAHYDDRMPRPEGATAGDTVFGGTTERPGNLTTDAFQAWLAARDGKRPFFAWIHYYDAHDPYLPPPPFDAKFRGREYAGEIAFVDSEIGRVLRALEDAGLASRTMVSVVADHGESLGQHGESTHGRTLYEEAMRVPWILAPAASDAREVAGGPGAGVAVTDVVSIVDVMPTLLDLLGSDTPEGLDGESLLRGPLARDRAVYLETLMPLFNNGWAPLFALRTRDLKYVKAPRAEFFRLTQDPFELSGADPTVTEARELARRLEERLARWPDPLALLSRGRPLAPESAQALSSLGYTSAPSADGSIGVLDPKDMLPAWETIERAIRLRGEAVGGDAPRKLAQALALIDGVLARSPRDRAALEQRARVLTALGRLEEAATALRAYVAIRPSSDAYVFLAQLAQARGKPEEVEPLARAALELEPSHGGAYLALGNWRFARGEFALAITEYENALRVDPTRARGPATQRLEASRKALAEGGARKP